MPAVSLLIKPVSSACNMRCAYCFYHDVAGSREVADFGKMSFDTLEIIMRQVFDIAEHMVSFGWQGGEPTLAGLEFFEKAIELQKKYNKNRIQVQNAIQTNGLALDEKWAKLLHDNKFLVGLSLDGGKAIHDKYRLDAQGNGTFERVIKAARLMDLHHVEYNILTTVNKEVAENIEKIYYLFKKHKFNFLQFIPCLDGYDGKAQEFSLTPTLYGDFLKRLFKLWYVDLNKGAPVSIRYFDNLAMMLAGYPPESCGMSGVCASYYMIEANGGVYPCDFYVTDEWLLGNVQDGLLEEMRVNETAVRFLEVSKQVPDDCKACRHYMICRGGCRRNREPISLGQNTKNSLCEAFMAFFDEAGEDLIKVAQKFVIGRK